MGVLIQRCPGFHPVQTFTPEGTANAVELPSEESVHMNILVMLQQSEVKVKEGYKSIEGNNLRVQLRTPPALEE